MPSPNFKVYTDSPISTGQLPTSNPRVESYDSFHSFIPELSTEDVDELEDLLVYGHERAQLQLQDLLCLDPDAGRHLDLDSGHADTSEEKSTATTVNEVRVLIEMFSLAIQGEIEAEEEQAYSTFREKVAGLLEKQGQRFKAKTPTRMPMKARVPLAELPIVKIRSGRSAPGRSAMSPMAMSGRPMANAHFGPAISGSHSQLDYSQAMQAMEEGTDTHPHIHPNAQFQIPPRAVVPARVHNLPPHTPPRHRNLNSTSLNSNLISGLNSESSQSTSSWSCSSCGSVCHWCNTHNYSFGNTTRMSSWSRENTSINSIRSNGSRITKSSSRPSSRHTHYPYHSSSSKTGSVPVQSHFDKNVRVMEILAAKGRKLRDILPALTMDEPSKGSCSLLSLSRRQEKTEVEKWLEVEMAK